MESGSLCLLDQGLLLRAVAAASLLAPVDTQSVPCAANDLITNSRQIAYSATSDQHDGVFLKVMTFTGNINSDFLAILNLKVISSQFICYKMPVCEKLLIQKLFSLVKELL